jgi:L-threonylcarbamoyladenylate synthase
MMEVLKINSRGLIKKIANLLKEGKVLICPTDTVYGLVADATNEKAVRKVLRIKRREKGKPIPIFVKDIKMAKELAEISKDQEEFLKKVWPGKITVVLKRRKNCGLAKILFGKEKTIGLRIPKYSFLNQLLKRLKRPLTGTSANISGLPASTKIKEVLSQFKNKQFGPDVLIDAGNLRKSYPSLVVDLTKSPPKILREGNIKKERILKLIKQNEKAKNKFSGSNRQRRKVALDL